MGRFQNRVVVSTDGAVSAVCNKGLAIQFRQRNRFQARPGVLLGDDHHVVLIANQVGGNSFDGGGTGDAQVSLTTNQLLFNDWGGVVCQIKPKRRLLIVRTQVSDQVRNQLLQRLQIGQLDHDLARTGQVFDHPLPAVQRLKRIPDAGEVGVAALGQDHISPFADKKFDVQLMLQI